MSILRFAPIMISIVAASLAVHTGCTPDEPSRRDVPKAIVSADAPVSEPSGTSADVPVGALASLEKVYVPLKAASLQSLDDALTANGYGNVRASDFEPQFETVDTELGAAVVAYSSADWIAPSSMFQPMSVTQWLEAALADDGAHGVIINPGHPGQTLALTDADITDALEWLPRQEPLAMEIYVSQ